MTETVSNDLISNIIQPYYDKIDQKYSTKDIWGYSTKFYDYDSITNGLHNSELTIIAARHSMGKSAFALNLATSLADQEIPVLYISYDLSKEAIAERLLSSIAEVDSNKIKSGNYSHTIFDKILPALGYIDKKINAFLHIIPNCYLNYKDLFEVIRKFKEDFNNGVIIVDYFQLIKLYRPEDTRIIELSSLAAEFKHLAMEIELPIILLSQVSKRCEDRVNKNPILSDLAECDALAQHSDNIIFIYREDYYKNLDDEEDYIINNKTKGEAIFTVAKQKNGPTGQFKLLFQAEINKFKNPLRSECF